MADYSGTEKIDIGRVLQRGFETIGRNAAGFLLLSVALAGVPAFAFEWISLSNNPDPATIFGGPGAGINFTAWLLTLFTSYLLNVALVRSVILDLSGRPPDLGGSLVNALSLILPMLGLTIVSSLGIGVGLLLLVVPGIIFYVMWIVAVPVLVEERAGVFASLSRSAALTEGSRWRVFAVVLIFLFFNGTLVAVTQSIAGEEQRPMVLGLIAGVSGTVYALLGAAMVASLYVELRTVKEGATADGLADIFA